MKQKPVYTRNSIEHPLGDILSQEYLEFIADTPREDGSPYRYQVMTPTGEKVLDIKFQFGGNDPENINGVTVSVVIQILIHHLKMRIAGKKFSNVFIDGALNALEGALRMLKSVK
jgi:hypothetical protein